MRPNKRAIGAYIAMMSAVYAAMSGNNDGTIGIKGCISTKKSEKPCLRCRTFHKHNNSFCSADCCKKYRQGDKYVSI